MFTLQKPNTKKVRKIHWAAIASLLTVSSLATAKPTYAFGVTYNFTVQINSSAYAAQGLANGTTEHGSFTYDTDGLTGSTSEQHVSASDGNLTLAFNFLDNQYTEQNDLNYGSQLYAPFYYPVAFFADGTLEGLDFLVVPSQLQPPQNALGFRIYKDAFYVGATDSSASGSGLQVGTVSYINAADVPPPPPSSGVAAVPEPSEVGGAIVALSVLGLWMRKVNSRT